MRYKGRKALFFAVIIYLLGVVVVTGCWLTFLQHESLNAFDKRLLASAQSLPELLPKDFHDRTLNKDSIGPEEDQHNLDNLSTHARIGGFAYLYTYVMDEGQIYFTASSYTDDDVANNKVSRYWTPYPEGDQAYFDAIHSNVPVFVTASDRWGTFRTVLIRRQSPAGNPYVIGADIDISVIHETLWKQVPWVVAAAFLLLLFAVPIAITMRRTLVAINNDLEQRVIERTTELLETNKLLQNEIKNRNETEEKYRVLFEKAGDAIFILDTAKENMGQIIDANKTAADMHGYTIEELKKINIRDLNAPEDAEKVTERIGRILRGDWIKSEIEHIRKDGTHFTVEVSAGAVELDEHQYILAFDRDITARKSLEAHLYQSQKMESIGNLAGGVAHDFNNILGGIIGYAQLIKNSSDRESKINRYAEQILKAGHRSAGVVKQILLFSRKTETRKSSVDISLIGKEVIELLKASIPSSIEIKYHFREDLSPVSADPTQIHQVFMNLCSNAAYAMKTGEKGLLEITIENIVVPKEGEKPIEEIPPGEYVELSISDTGQGMNKEIMEKIFDPYFTTKEVGEGSGLGLATVHGIVQDHDGIIRVKSVEGQGTTFHIYFPAIRQTVEEVQKTWEILRGSETILFVDDEAYLAEVGKEMLENHGYRVESFISSIKAWETFSKAPAKYHIVITDYTMPEMTGEKLARKIREIRPELPIIMCTGISLDSEITKDLKLEKVMTKPLDIYNLLQVVRNILD